MALLDRPSGDRAIRPSGRLRRAGAWLAAAVVCLTTATQAAAQAQPAIEASVKAVFLFNFAKYVSWPATAMR